LKTAIITRITGQLGAILAEKLLKQDYKIYGLRRRASTFNTERIEHILQDVHVNDKLELVYVTLRKTPPSAQGGDRLKIGLLINPIFQPGALHPISSLKLGNLHFFNLCS
jgi:hypothetical protein